LVFLPSGWEGERLIVRLICKSFRNAVKYANLCYNLTLLILY
jgi:hypothetical protein